MSSSPTDVLKLLSDTKVDDLKSQDEIILDGQYRDAYDTMLDAHNANLYVGLIGPVGSGKTALCRKFAADLGKPFDWVTFSDLVRPSNLIGSFDPTLVFKYGFSPEAFVPGPFTISALSGGVFLANELNRGDEYVLNTLLDALELEATGGTRVDAALTWAAEQFESVPEVDFRLLFLLSDFMFFEKPDELRRHGRRLGDAGVQLLAASHGYSDQRTITLMVDTISGQQVALKTLAALPGILMDTLKQIGDG